MSTVSVIILTRDRCELLQLTLTSLARQTRVPDEVLVIDNGSEDGTGAMLAAARTPYALRVIEGTGASFAEARNQGVAASTGELIAFLDDDCEADRFWLERLAGALDEHGWVAAGGPVLAADELDAPRDYSPELAWAAGLSPPGILGAEAGRRHLPATASLIARREVFLEFPFQAIGGSFGRSGGDYDFGREDAEWWAGLRRAGRFVGIAKRALVWHHVGQERLEMEYLGARIEADGRAHWNRTRRRESVPAATRDVLNLPAVAARAAMSRERGAREGWVAARLWARRQRAFLSAAVDDADAPLAPTHRLGAFLREGGRLLAAGGKAGTRLAVREAAAMARRQPELPSPERPPKSLLVILHDLLGDAVLALPMIKQLAASFPDCRIVVMTGPVAGPLLKASLEGCAHAVEIPPRARGRSPRAALELSRFVSARPADGCIIAYCHGLSPLPLVAQTRWPVISWKRDNGFCQRLWGDLVSVPVEKTQRQHEVVALLNLLAPLGVEARLERPAVRFREAAAARVGRIVEAANFGSDDFAVLHVERDGRSKFWPAANSREIAARLRDAGVPVVFIGSREGRAAVEELLDNGRRVISLHGVLDSEELAALLARAGLFLGSDSGPAHVAEAVKCPGHVIFGFDDPARWGPLPGTVSGRGPSLGVLRAGPGDWLPEETEGLPWDFATAPLTVDAVWSALQPLLARKTGVNGLAEG